MSDRAALSHWQSPDPGLAGRSPACPKPSGNWTSFPELPRGWPTPGTHCMRSTNPRGTVGFILPAAMCSHLRDRGWRYLDRQARTILPAGHHTWLLGTTVTIPCHFPPVRAQAVKRLTCKRCCRWWQLPSSQKPRLPGPCHSQCRPRKGLAHGCLPALAARGQTPARSSSHQFSATLLSSG